MELIAVFLLKDEYDKVVDYYCPPFKDLWKVRFNEHPYNSGLIGWGQDQYKPSQGQQVYLEQNYGIKNILTQYIYGDSLFKLLKNVQDKEWIKSYQTISSP